MMDVTEQVQQGLTTPTCAINRIAPYESYIPDQLSHFFTTLDVMARYPNTLGVLAASMLTNNDATVSATPVLSAVVRDVKRYIQLKYGATGQRILPVGYEAASTGGRDRTILDYSTFGEQSETIDFWTVSCCVDCEAIRRTGSNASIVLQLFSLHQRLGSCTIWLQRFGTCLVSILKRPFYFPNLR